MPVFEVQLKAEMVEINDLTMVTDDGFNVECQCGNCGEEHKNLWIIPREEFENPGNVGNNKSTVNMILKCKGCQRQGSIKYLDDMGVGTYTREDDDTFKTMASFEVRGLDLKAWKLSGEVFTCKGAKSGTEFVDVDLGDDFYDYDEGADANISITKIETRVVKGTDSKKKKKKKKK